MVRKNKALMKIVMVCGVLLVVPILLIRFFNTSAFFEWDKQESEHRGKIISGNFKTDKIKTEAEWKAVLTPEQYHILREAGTEIPFTGALLPEKRKGTYVSVGCEQPVFRSEQKYESGTGWPSFWAPVNENAVVLREDSSLGTTRVEVLDVCGGHLGHVFNDGPEPTGKRYCMNSAALRFIPD